MTLTKETRGRYAGAGDATPRAILYEARREYQPSFIELLTERCLIWMQTMWGKFKPSSAKIRLNDVTYSLIYFTSYLTPPVLSDVVESVNYFREIRSLI